MKPILNLEKSFPTAAAALRRYRDAVRGNSRLYRIIVTAAGLLSTGILTLWVRDFVIASAMTFLFWLIPASVVILLFLPLRSPKRALFWFYRAVFAVVYAAVMLLINVYYKRVLYEDSPSYGRINFYIWVMLWLVPAAGMLLPLALNRFGSRQTAKGSAFGVFWKQMKLLYHPFSKKEKRKEKLPAKRKLSAAARTLFFLIAAGLFTAGAFLAARFPHMEMEAVIFTVRYSKNNYSAEVRSQVMILVAGVLLLTLLAGLRFLMQEKTARVTVSSPDGRSAETIETDAVRRLRLIRLLPTMLLAAAGLLILADTLKLKDYIYGRLHTSQLYEEYYIEPSPELIRFPEQKKNLIYIYLESYENTFTSFQKGGNQPEDYMPELYALEQENVNFSDRAGVGGMSVFVPTTLYTMGSTVAQTSGVSLMTPLGITINKMEFYSAFLPSLIRLEDIMDSAGYHQMYMLGSNAEFAGYDQYVGRFENSEIYDFRTAQQEGRVPKGYQFAWGLEDYKLFPIIKEKLTELSEQDAPFFFTFYTIDTHSYEGGNRCPYCDDSITNDYLAAVRCGSRQVSEFLKWLEEQPYYEDTVIILVGDHIADSKIDGIRYEDGDYVRTAYNCIIHPQKDAANTQNREYCAMDMFPTTLSAIGAEIEGDRLGLGTDLFSDTPTLCEQLGTETFTSEVQLRSDYYNDHFWNDEAS